jgi:hypothetical protein
LNILIGKEALTSGAFSSLGRDGSPTMPNQDSMVDMKEFPSLRSSTDSRLRQHCVIEGCNAKKQLLRSTILVSCAEQPNKFPLEFPDKQLQLLLNRGA